MRCIVQCFPKEGSRPTQSTANQGPSFSMLSTNPTPAQGQTCVQNRQGLLDKGLKKQPNLKTNIDTIMKWQTHLQPSPTTKQSTSSNEVNKFRANLCPFRKQNQQVVIKDTICRMYRHLVVKHQNAMTKAQSACILKHVNHGGKRETIFCKTTSRFFFLANVPS